MRSNLAPLLRHLSLAAAVCALLFAGIGYFGPNFVDKSLHEGILQNIVWRPDSPPEVDARFRGADPPPDGEPDYLRVWMWNLTNLPEVRKGAKPKMVEVGPLTYVKSRVKLDPLWGRSGRVTVKEWDYHVFQPELSAARPDDVITTVNLPLVGVLEALHAHIAASPAMQPLVDVMVGVLSGWRDAHVDGLFTRRSAGELLWGYEDLLLQRLVLLPLGPSLIKSTLVQLLRNDSEEDVRAAGGYNIIDTGWRPAGRQAMATATVAAAAAAASTTAFGHLYDGVSGGGGSGNDAAARLGQGRQVEYDIESIWNMEMESGWSLVTSWGPNCTETVRGTDAFQFRPGLDRRSSLRVWIAELFRSAQLFHVADEELYGVQLLRFVPNPAEAEPDPCHHQHIRGLANVTVPMAVGPGGNGSSVGAHGVPILMSLPHYCLVDESVPGALEGMRCDPPRHGIFLDVEPTTGITMRAAKRLQLSSQLTAASRRTLEPTLGSDLILPVFWAEEASAISAAQAAVFRGSVYRALRISAAARAWSYPAAAAAVTLAAIALAAARLLAARVPAATAVAAAPPPQPPRRHETPANRQSGNGGVDDGGGDGDGVLVPAVAPLPAPPPLLQPPPPHAAATPAVLAADLAAASDGDDRTLEPLAPE